MLRESLKSKQRLLSLLLALVMSGSLTAEAAAKSISSNKDGNTLPFNNGDFQNNGDGNEEKLEDIAEASAYFYAYIYPTLKAQMSDEKTEEELEKEVVEASAFFYQSVYPMIKALLAENEEMARGESLSKEEIAMIVTNFYMNVYPLIKAQIAGKDFLDFNLVERQEIATVCAYFYMFMLPTLRAQMNQTTDGDLAIEYTSDLGESNEVVSKDFLDFNLVERQEIAVACAYFYAFMLPTLRAQMNQTTNGDLAVEYTTDAEGYSLSRTK